MICLRRKTDTIRPRNNVIEYPKDTPVWRQIGSFHILETDSARPDTHPRGRPAAVSLPQKRQRALHFRDLQQSGLTIRDYSDAFAGAVSIVALFAVTLLIVAVFGGRP